MITPADGSSQVGKVAGRSASAALWAWSASVGTRPSCIACTTLSKSSAVALRLPIRVISRLWNRGRRKGCPWTRSTPGRWSRRARHRRIPPPSLSACRSRRKRSRKIRHRSAARALRSQIRSGSGGVDADVSEQNPSRSARPSSTVTLALRSLLKRATPIPIGPAPTTRTFFPSATPAPHRVGADLQELDHRRLLECDSVRLHPIGLRDAQIFAEAAVVVPGPRARGRSRQALPRPGRQAHGP